MLKIVVNYFLNEQGIEYFQKWYKEVYDITSKQDGFIKMYVEVNQANPVVYLYFDNEEKLDEWASTEIHNKLATKIYSQQLNFRRGVKLRATGVYVSCK